MSEYTNQISLLRNMNTNIRDAKWEKEQKERNAIQAKHDKADAKLSKIMNELDGEELISHNCKYACKLSRDNDWYNLKAGDRSVISAKTTYGGGWEIAYDFKGGGVYQFKSTNDPDVLLSTIISGLGTWGI